MNEGNIATIFFKDNVLYCNKGPLTIDEVFGLEGFERIVPLFKTQLLKSHLSGTMPFWEHDLDEHEEAGVHVEKGSSVNIHIDYSNRLRELDIRKLKSATGKLNENQQILQAIAGADREPAYHEVFMLNQEAIERKTEYSPNGEVDAKDAEKLLEGTVVEITMQPDSIITKSNKYGPVVKTFEDLKYPLGKELAGDCTEEEREELINIYLKHANNPRVVYPKEATELVGNMNMTKLKDVWTLALYRPKGFIKSVVGTVKYFDEFDQNLVLAQKDYAGKIEDNHHLCSVDLNAIKTISSYQPVQ